MFMMHDATIYLHLELPRGMVPRSWKALRPPPAKAAVNCTIVDTIAKQYIDFATMGRLIISRGQMNHELYKSSSITGMRRVNIEKR